MAALLFAMHLTEFNNDPGLRGMFASVVAALSITHPGSFDKDFSAAKAELDYFLQYNTISCGISYS